MEKLQILPLYSRNTFIAVVRHPRVSTKSEVVRESKLLFLLNTFPTPYIIWNTWAIYMYPSFFLTPSFEGWVPISPPNLIISLRNIRHLMILKYHLKEQVNTQPTLKYKEFCSGCCATFYYYLLTERMEELSSANWQKNHQHFLNVLK